MKESKNPTKENIVREQVKAVMNQIEEKHLLLEAIKEKIRFFINERVIPGFNALSVILETDYNISCIVDNKWNEATLTLYMNKEDIKNSKFQYRLWVENSNEVVVHSSNLDPDMNVFRPKDIFGDYEELDISNITEALIIKDFLERFKLSELKILEDSFLIELSVTEQPFN